MPKVLHGHWKAGRKSPTYQSWAMMRERCNRTANDNYANYGGRGIKVCERWAKFANFLADMGERPEGMTLDRIDVNKDYCKENCKWSDIFEQRANRRDSRECAPLDDDGYNI